MSSSENKPYSKTVLKHLHFLYLFGGLLFLQMASFAQGTKLDSIFLLNGQIVAAKIVDSLPNLLTARNEEKKGKLLRYEPEQLYLVRYAAGFKRYYYSQDANTNNWLSREEVWMYMKGERDAHKGFKARGALVAAGLFGLAGGMTGTFWAPIAPYGFMALTGLPKIRIRHRTVSDISYLKSDAYIMGYERVARQKLKIKSLIGGTVGLVLGYGIYAIFHDHYPESLNIGFIK